MSVNRLNMFNQLAMSYGLVVISGLPVFAQVPVDTVNTSQIIHGGTYFNTPGHSTEFTNPKGLWLQKGLTVNGVEVFSDGNPTRNGGFIMFNAPNAVVRLDGDVNVAGFNGGSVAINAAYLYQSGRIEASGNNMGGHVSINVNSATFAPGSIINTGATNVPGTIMIDATSFVELQKTAELNTSGSNRTDFNNDVISIVGGLVNNSGVIRADGVFRADVNGRGGISLSNRNPIDLQPLQNALSTTNVLTPCVAKSLFSHIQQETDRYGESVVNSGLVSVNGLNTPANEPGFGGDGGVLYVSSPIGFINNGVLQANGGNAGATGGNGGFIRLDSFTVFNNGRIAANGSSARTGGNGGEMQIIGANYFENNGTMTANGGSISQNGVAGGNGGAIYVSSEKILNSASGVMSVNGGDATTTVSHGIGGNGGGILLEASAGQYSKNYGKLFAKGGNGRGSTGHGGAGGSVREANVINVPGSIVDTSPGTP